MGWLADRMSMRFDGGGREANTNHREPRDRGREENAEKIGRQIAAREADKKEEQKEKPYSPTPIDSSKLMTANNLQAQNMISNNINNFNAAVGSQRTINPALAAIMFGQNAAQTNNQIGAAANYTNAQLDYNTQVANEGMKFQFWDAKEKNRINEMLGTAQINAQQDAANKAFWGGILGTAAGVFGKLGSDERIKKDKEKIDDDDGDMEDYLSSLSPYKFKYKDDMQDSDRMGVMAQNVEKTEAGKTIVSENDNGVKQLDVAQMVGANSAALGYLHKKLKSIEEMIRNGNKR